jgi:DNA-binding beta-propeller fold protein YncE
MIGKGFSVILALLLVAPAWSRSKEKEALAPQVGPELQMDGGRRLTYEGFFSSERELHAKRGFWKKVLDVVVGAPDYRRLLRPYSIAADSRGRVIVTDPGAAGIHIFDFTEKKYKFLYRWDRDKDPMLTPQCVAVDAQDNFYVTDSVSGKIFVFDSSGKFRHVIGSVKGGEGYFKRPTGIAVDSKAQRIYVTDTLRDKVFILDLQGNVLTSFGKRGTGTGEFNLPTEVHLQGDNVAVVDAMNFRVEFFDHAGAYRFSIGTLGDELGQVFRPKGVAFDSEGHLYVVEGLANVVQVFNRESQLLYYFGQRGSGPGEFQLPAGLFIDRDDRIFVVDSFNRRIQIFHYYGLPKRAALGTP